MRFSFLVFALFSVGCLPVSGDLDHPLDRYNYNGNRPWHVAASGTKVCAATGSAETRCWGFVGAPWGAYDLPFSIAQTAGVRSVAVTETIVCGLGEQGQVLCAGQSLNGVLGHNGTQSEATPLLSGSFVRMKGSSTKVCARRQDTEGFGSLTCWGENSYQVFQGSESSNDRTPFELQPELDGAALDIRQFGVGQHHICVSTLNPNKIVCWGKQNVQADDFPTAPREVLAIPNEHQLEPHELCVGEQHACVILKTGENDRNEIHCWGDNTHGQVKPDNLGGNFQPQVINVPIVPGKIFCADNHTCAVTSSGEQPVCWGDNRSNQLGGEPDQAGVAKVTMLPDLEWTQIVGGADFSCALTSGINGLYCWGSNADGQLGNPNSTGAPDRATIVDFFHDQAE